MEKLIKTTGIFFGLGLLNTVIFTMYLRNTGLPGGEVGMIPFLIAMESGIAIILSTVTYLLIRNRIVVTTIWTIVIYQVAYFLTLIFSGVNPLDNDLTDVFKTLNMWIYLVSFLATIGLIMTIKVIDRVKTNRS